MDRKEFVAALGISAASFAVFNCLGCAKGGEASGGSAVNGPTGVDFTLDLTTSANAPLLSNGGFLASNGVIVAKTAAGAYIAVQQSCTHESYTLIYQSGSQRFFCNNHGATFSEKGTVTTGPANKSLIVYNTTLTGTSLRVYS